MICDDPGEEEIDTRRNSSTADLTEKIDELEGRLEDALMLKREVETQAEIIRLLTRRVEAASEGAEQMEQQIAAFQSMLTYRVTYRVKAAVYREIQSLRKWWKRN